MAGPFCALWAQGRRAAAHSGGPRPSRPASASLRPRPRCGLGLGAALRAGRKRPGPRPSPPHTPPARLGAADGKARGCQPCGLVGAPVRALWARPSRPQRPAGRYPCPPWAAWAPPAPPACGGRGYVAAGRRLRRLRSRPCGACQPPAVARGHLPAPQGQAPFGGALRAALPRSSPSPVAASVLRAAPPPLVGAFGAVRPSGPGGPGSGQPPRAGPPAALPALVRLCLRLARPA